jgi:phage internal scaffolding protein
MKEIQEIIVNGKTRKKVQTLNTEPSKTQQQFSDSQNINNIMAKYHNNLAHLPPPSAGHYGDFSNIQSFQDSLDAVRNASDAFSALPSKLRARFENDPAQLIAFVSDKANLEEARSLGLIAPAAIPTETQTLNSTLQTLNSTLSTSNSKSKKQNTSSSED